MKNLSLVSGTSNLFINGIEFEFNNSIQRDKTIKRLKKLGFGFGRATIFNEEFEGLCEAGKNGFNPYECTILAGKYSVSI
jgi:hypothetical protein